MDKAVFTEQITGAYTRLYDLAYLRTHPLLNIIVPDPAKSRKEKAWKMHDILLDVIKELKPESQANTFARQQRRYQLVMLRYVKGLEPQVVADQLSISRRHYYREHSIALESIADILWHRYIENTEPTENAAAEDQASVSHLELLRIETARMAQTSRNANPCDVIDSVLPLLQGLLSQRQITLNLALPETVPQVVIDQSIFRQMLLGVLGYLIESTNQSAIVVQAQVSAENINFSMHIRPDEAASLTLQAAMRDRFLMFEEMASLNDIAITPQVLDDRITGFELRLPISHRTLLVVDDNPDILELFRRHLEAAQYHVVTTHTAENVVELARLIKPYAITLDLMMPGQDGWDLLQVLLNQRETQNIPVIVCSLLKQKELALSLGATAFLEKPVKEQALLKILAVLEKE